MVTVALLVVALVIAFRAHASASESASHLAILQARLQAIERDLARLMSSSRAAMPPGAPTGPQPIPTPPSVAVPPPSSATPARSSPLAPASARAASRELSRFEAEIGSRWMLVAGIVVLVFGVVFFVKYAFDRGLISETWRIAIGTVAGLSVWAFGLSAVRRDYALFGRLIAGGGLAMMFLSAWAAAALYGLVPLAIGFVWVAAVAGLATVTADHEASPGLALVAVVFAYGAPFLLSSASDHHLALFSYEIVLAAAALFLVRRHGWPSLGLASWCATWMTFVVWMARFYRPAIFGSTEMYLVVVSSVFIAMNGVYRRHPGDRGASLAQYVLSAGPVAFHLASVYVLFDQSPWFLAYMISATAICVVLFTGRPVLRLIAWCAAAWPLVVWIDLHGASTGWFGPAIVTTFALYAMHFIPSLNGLASAEARTEPAITEVLLFQCNGVGTFAFAYLLFDAHAHSTPLLAGWMAAWYLVLAWRLRGALASAAPHALATGFTLAAIAIALALTGPWVTAAYAAEGTAVVAVGLRSRQAFFRLTGLVLVAFAVVRLVALQFAATPAVFTPLANSRTLTGAFIVALLYAVAWEYRRQAVAFGEEATRARALAILAANVLTLGLLTADVNSYWTARPDQLTAGFSKQLGISVTWAAYAMVVIAAGFARQSATLRFLALVLFAATVVKMFLVDLLALGGVYRISGFLALGLLLLAASFLYQRHRPQTSG
jgi:uncharacterized membrane protein